MVQTTNKQATTALAQLAEYRQWVGWEYRQGKSRKVPVNPHTWRDASSTDASTWGSYDEAKEAGSKVGFVFSELDPFTGIDLDDCVEDGEVLPWAMEIVLLLDSYTEISPSNTGLKIWVKASKPGTHCKTGSIEVYERYARKMWIGEFVRHAVYLPGKATERAGAPTPVGRKHRYAKTTSERREPRRAHPGSRRDRPPGSA